MRIFFAGLVAANDLANHSLLVSMDIHVQPFANHFIVADLEKMRLIQIGPAISLAFNNARMLTFEQLNLSMFCVCFVYFFVHCLFVYVLFCFFVYLLYHSRTYLYMLLFVFVFVHGFRRLLKNMKNENTRSHVFR